MAPKPTAPKNKMEQPKITPEAGWDHHSPYGALQDLERNPLERLEAVHALLMERDGLTSMDAAARVFGPFLSDGNSELGMKHGADKLLPYLLVCDPADRAYSLFPVGKYADRSSLERLAELVPYVPHHRFDKGTSEALLYALGQMAGEVWAKYSGDVDLNDRPCASFAEGYFPSATKAREILGAFAVRHDLAHKLWGWGTVAAVVTPLRAVLPERVDSPDKSTPLTAQAIKDGAGKNKRGEWTDDAKALMVAASEAGKLDGEKIQDVAKMFGLTRQAFSGAVSRPTKGTRSKINATPAKKQATR